uniref:DDE Tnp4 domain-containing protein n=1 Tax=Trichogramma kaykai TaxID=54128 RepID=A0ABD2VZ16_9HYME
MEKEQEIVEENSNQREYSNLVSAVISPVHIVDQIGSNEQTTAERDFADDENQIDDSFNGQYAANPIKKDQSIQVDYQKSIISSLCDSDENLKILTGIKSNKLLNMLIDCISDLRKNKKKKTIQILSIRECILLIFVKLYQNVAYRVLSVYFGLTSAMAKKCFVRTLKELALVLKSVLRWPSKQEILSNMPKYFNDYKETRIVLDCLEIPVKRSKCLKFRLLTYSNYKSRNTIKFMIGTTPSGLISYVSQAYGGRVSDKAIFKHSRFLDRMKRGIDAIMVDGFLIHKECADLGIKLIRPPFLKKKSQLSHTEVTKGSDISDARVHVERRIQRIRKFSIMQGPLSIEIVPYINIIMIVICGLTNMYSPILAADKFL